MKNLILTKGTDFLFLSNPISGFQFTIPFDKIDYIKLLEMPESAKQRLAVYDHVVVCVEGVARKLFIEHLASPLFETAEELYDQLILWVYGEVQPTPTPTPTLTPTP